MINGFARLFAVRKIEVKNHFMNRAARVYSLPT